MTARRWAVITGEYPPQRGGVADHCGILASLLASEGDHVEVWAPPHPGRQVGDISGIRIHDLPARYNLATLRLLHRQLAALSEDTIILLHYVPQMYGWRGMNVAFCWLMALRRPAKLWIMFHELYMPFGWRVPLKHQLLGLVQRLMVVLLLRSSAKVLVTIPRWGSLLQRWTPQTLRPVLAPIPSNIIQGVPQDPQVLAVLDSLRARLEIVPESPIVGHFGSFGAAIAKFLSLSIPVVLASPPYPAMLLIGYGAADFAATLKPSLPPRNAARVYSIDAAPGADIAALIGLCQVMMQPYPDGVTTRRSTMMACLSLNKAVVTNLGPLSDPLWAESRATRLVPPNAPVAMARAVSKLLLDGKTCSELGEIGLELYMSNFSWDHLIGIYSELAS